MIIIKNRIKHNQLSSINTTLEFIERRAKYTRDTGKPINSPESLTDYYTYIGRQKGKTYTLIQTLPSNEKVILVIHNRSVKRYIISLINSYRPDINIKNILFHTYNYSFDEISPRIDIYQNKYKVYFDNAVFDMMNIHLTAKYNRIV